MGERVNRAASSRRGQKVLGKHGDKVSKAADTAAITAGLGWIALIGLFALVLLVVWLIAVIVAKIVMFVVALLVTLAVVPPLWREIRKRSEVRRAIKGD